MLADHGFLRLAYRNRHPVAEGLWRSAQPAPADIAWAAKAGIRTVLSLRGEGFGGDLLEREACERYGLAFHRLPLFSRGAPRKESLREAMRLFPTLAQPVLLHCKSGADRAGLGAALWLIIVENRPAAEAARMLSLRYGHIAEAKTGVLDAFVRAWAETGEAKGLPFETWVETVYDPDTLDAAFTPARWADRLLAILRRE